MVQCTMREKTNVLAPVFFFVIITRKIYQEVGNYSLFLQNVCYCKSHSLIRKFSDSKLKVKIWLFYVWFGENSCYLMLDLVREFLYKDGGSYNLWYLGENIVEISCPVKSSYYQIFLINCAK